MSKVKITKVAASAAALSLEIDVDGERLYVAFHNSAVASNGWEPYDQPNRAAYVPLSKDRLHELQGADGVLWISKESH